MEERYKDALLHTTLLACYATSMRGVPSCRACYDA
jgi:hypothetical protein